MLQHTTMFHAFTKARIAKSLPFDHPFVGRVVASMERYAKSRKAGKSWTARLSFRTARYLGSKGVPLQ